MENNHKTPFAVNGGTENTVNDEQDRPAVVPYFVYEGEMVRNERELKIERDRNERTVKRLVIATVVAIVLLFASNIAWLIYESQFDTVSYSQDGAGVNNINTGEQGDVTYEPTPKSEEAP